MTGLDEWESGNDWKSGFTPIKAGEQPPQQPKPRCAVADCERVVYKSVVCRKHWRDIPIEIRMKRMIDAQLAQQVAKSDTDLEIMEHFGVGE